MLPDAFGCADGSRVETAQDWIERRRPELLDLFGRHMYGVTPPHQVEVRSSVVAEDTAALAGRATRVEVLVSFGPQPAGLSMRLRLYLPDQATGPVPAFLGLNFRGNQVVESGPDESGAGDGDRRHEPWPLARLLERGYAVATACYEDIDPDTDDFGNGVHPLFYRGGQTRPGPHEWGAIGAWAWGLRRALDVLVDDPRIDGHRVVAVGHSRLGKAALWAAAQDERFAMVVSNNSGCGGAALSRRRVGETVDAITQRFPHWFCSAFASYARKEETLPVDQHLLLALIAPRPLYVASAQEDTWADPLGEFLGACHASPVYRMLGVEGLAVDEMPAVSSPVTSRIGYHIRPGGHAMTAYDWDRFADAADRHLSRAE